MFKLAILGACIVLLPVVPNASQAQQAEAPVYKDGDWWRVKVEALRPTGVTVAGPQFGRFPEYIIKFESGKPKVFGILANETKESGSPGIIALVLGKSGWRGDLLRFPMRAALTWSDQFQYQPRGMQMRWEEGRYEVQSWEKVKTPKGEFDALSLS